jgi:hypothetical protein
MKKFDEIGGNFWVTTGNVFEKECNDNLVKISQCKNVEYVSSGRDGIRLIIQQHHINKKIVLLPVFTCESIIKPFKWIISNNLTPKNYQQQKWSSIKCKFYAC